MRKTWIPGTVLAALVVLAPFAAFAQSDGSVDQSYARLSYVKGEATLEKGAELGTEAAEVNLPVAEGNKLVTGDGQAEVQFGRNNFLRLGIASEAEFAALPVRGDDPFKIHIRIGQAYLRVTTLEAEKGIEVHTPDVSFYILEAGLYRFDVAEDGATEIMVHEGSAEAAGEGGSAVVRANQRLVAANGEFRSDPETFSAAMDGFDRWNETRDALRDRQASSSYLPSAISEYENELDDNGRWVNEASYGYVWVPTIQDLEWRPYYYGRWAWYPIIGWTWVSSEPWGWATYHYGRWQWRFGMGWYWIPTSHWGPAWVHWYHGRDHYGWCPLSYYNRPGVILNGRYHDRWRGDDYPWNSRALTVVHRDRLQSPAISRHALRSSELGSLGRISLKAAQPAARPSIGRAGLSSSLSGRTLSGAGSRATIKERGSISKGTLRSPSSASPSGINSKSRTLTSPGRTASAGSLSGSVSGSISRVRSNAVVERPSSLSSRSLSGGTRSVVPRSSSRSYTPLSKSSSRGAAMGYPSTIKSRSTGTSSSRSTSGVRQYSSSPSVRSYSSRSYSSGSLSRSPSAYSGSSYSRGTSVPRSGSYSAPSYSPRSYSSSPSYSRGASAPRSYSYSAPSYSGRSYSRPSGSVSRSSGSYSGSSSSRSYSAPRSSGSSKGSSSSPSRSSSSSRSSASSRSSSSSGRSGNVHKR